MKLGTKRLVGGQQESALQVATIYYDLPMIKLFLKNRFKSNFEWMNVFRYLNVADEIYSVNIFNQPLPPEIKNPLAITLRNRDTKQLIFLYHS